MDLHARWKVTFKYKQYLFWKLKPILKLYDFFQARRTCTPEILVSSLVSLLCNDLKN